MISSFSAGRASLRKFYLILAVLLGILVIGIVGFTLIEDFSFLESFYMTVITLSTVGFKEVKPLSPPGQWFTAFLIISSFGTFAYGFSLLAQSVLSGELTAELKRRRLEKSIKNLNGHVIICGFGRNGRRAYKKMQAYGKAVVVVENNSQIVERYLHQEKIMFMEGDATSDETLEQAGVDRASSLITTLSKDSDNLFVVITARSMNKNLHIVSRASNESTEKKLRAVGVNAVVMPEAVGGAHMATLVVNPNIVEFLDHISVEGSSNINLEEVELSDFSDDPSEFNLSDLEIRQKTGCTVIGLKTPEGKYQINPDSEEKLTRSSKLFVLGNSDQIRSLNDYLKTLK